MRAWLLCHPCHKNVGLRVWGHRTNQWCVGIDLWRVQYVAAIQMEYGPIQFWLNRFVCLLDPMTREDQWR